MCFCIKVSSKTERFKAIHCAISLDDMDIRIANKYRLGRKIGGGSFGDIYLAINIQTGEEVAIKLEHMNAKHPQLHIECKFYKIMQGGGWCIELFLDDLCDKDVYVLKKLSPIPSLK